MGISVGLYWRKVLKITGTYLALLSLIIAGVGGVASARVVTNASPSFPIAAHYQAPGSWAVSTSQVTDGSGNVYDLYYPTNLGAGGFLHPLLTWGNGTDQTPSQYSALLNQLASWGFVIIASTSPTTGTGSEMIAGINYMSAQNLDSSSIFYGKLNLNEIGAIGHSQGAGGTVNATNNSGGRVKTAVPINLPDQKWVSSGDEFYVNQLTVPVFFLGGSQDKTIAPPSTIQGYYNQVPGAAAMAVLNKAGHLTIEDAGNGYLGYITAWMMYQLQGDTYARQAFVGNPPEININTNWSYQAEKFLP